MPIILMIILAIFTAGGGAIGFNLAEHKEPIVKCLQSGCEACEECVEPIEPIAEDCTEIAADLMDCWNAYSNECSMIKCVQEECEDTQKYLIEINSLQKSRQGAKENESKLLEELTNCKDKLIF